MSSMRLDAADADDMARFAEAVLSDHGRLDIWVGAHW